MIWLYVLMILVGKERVSKSTCPALRGVHLVCFWKCRGFDESQSTIQYLDVWRSMKKFEEKSVCLFELCLELCFMLVTGTYLFAGIAIVFVWFGCWYSDCVCLNRWLFVSQLCLFVCLFVGIAIMFVCLVFGIAIVFVCLAGCWYHDCVYVCLFVLQLCLLDCIVFMFVRLYKLHSIFCFAFIVCLFVCVESFFFLQLE